MGVTSQILKNKLAISCNIYLNIVKHVPFPSWVTPILPKEPHSPLLVVLHPITRNIIPRTQHIPNHSITPPLGHISSRRLLFLGSAHSPHLEVYTIPRGYYPSRGNAPSPHQKVFSALRGNHPP